MINIDYKEFANFRTKVKNKWFNTARDLWWGDRIDCRFLALYQLKSIKNKKILDLGCNCGISLSQLDKSNQRFGLDMSERALRIAKEINTAEVNLFKADMKQLPIKNDSFDVVMLFGMLELLNKEERFDSIKQITPILKKGGILYVTSLNSDYLSLNSLKTRTNYAELLAMLSNDYKFSIYGFNPFPGFPFFLPNRILACLPFIWEILLFSLNHNFFTKNSCSFYVFAKKL